jgi:hypothetical protein
MLFAEGAIVFIIVLGMTKLIKTLNIDQSGHGDVEEESIENETPGLRGCKSQAQG